jgi:hypothetical protein
MTTTPTLYHGYPAMALAVKVTAADVTGHFAVHTQLDGSGRWVVTHKLSGCRMPHTYDSLEDAANAAKRLEAFGDVWASDSVDGIRNAAADLDQEQLWLAIKGTP